MQKINPDFLIFAALIGLMAVLAGLEYFGFDNIRIVTGETLLGFLIGIVCVVLYYHKTAATAKKEHEEALASVVAYYNSLIERYEKRIDHIYAGAIELAQKEEKKAIVAEVLEAAMKQERTHFLDTFIIDNMPPGFTTWLHERVNRRE